MSEDKPNQMIEFIFIGACVGIISLIAVVNIPASIYNFCTNNQEGIVLAKY